jgi:hypothetical protein
MTTAIFFKILEDPLLKWRFWRVNVYFLHGQISSRTPQKNRWEQLESHTATLVTATVILSWNAALYSALQFKAEDTVQAGIARWFG